MSPGCRRSGVSIKFSHYSNLGSGSLVMSKIIQACIVSELREQTRIPVVQIREVVSFLEGNDAAIG